MIRNKNRMAMKKNVLADNLNPDDGDHGNQGFNKRNKNATFSREIIDIM
jgi:hypothetical protein